MATLRTRVDRLRGRALRSGAGISAAITAGAVCAEELTDAQVDLWAAHLRAQDPAAWAALAALEDAELAQVAAGESGPLLARGWQWDAAGEIVFGGAGEGRALTETKGENTL